MNKKYLVLLTIPTIVQSQVVSQKRIPIRKDTIIKKKDSIVFATDTIFYPRTDTIIRDRIIHDSVSVVTVDTTINKVVRLIPIPIPIPFRYTKTKTIFKDHYDTIRTILQLPGKTDTITKIIHDSIISNHLDSIYFHSIDTIRLKTIDTIVIHNGRDTLYIPCHRDTIPYHKPPVITATPEPDTISLLTIGGLFLALVTLIRRKR